MERQDPEIIRQLVKMFTSDSYEPELLDLFREWIANPANEEEKDSALYEVWNDTASEGSTSHASKMFKALEECIGLPSRNTALPVRRMGLRIAAVILLPLFIAAGVMFYKERQSSAGEVTAESIGMIEDAADYLMLEDGSEVWIGERGTVIAEGERENILVGDALYNVKREYMSGKRFRVRTQYLTATVFGTVFRVTALPDAEQTIVTLYEGTLGINIPEGNYIIETGTRFIYNNITGEYITEEIGEIWPEQIEERVFVYRSESISSVFEAIERLYGVTVDHGGYSWSSEAVTLKFTAATNLENVLYMLSGITGNLEYRVTDDRVFICDK